MKRTWLEEIRKNKGFTHAQMGKMLGVTRQAYTSIENGRRNPSLSVALKLCKILDFDPALFLDKEVAVRNHEKAI